MLVELNEDICVEDHLHSIPGRPDTHSSNTAALSFACIAGLGKCECRAEQMLGGKHR